MQQYFLTSNCPVNMNAIRDKEMNSVNKSIKGKQQVKENQNSERHREECFFIWCDTGC